MNTSHATTRSPLLPRRGPGSVAFRAAPGMNGVLLSFLLGAATAFAIFLPFLVVDKGFFIYCGDYNSQQLPFYYHVHEFLRAGGGTWDWATDLGSSIISSYSFYNLGSPFLWLTMLFPSRWLPYLMVPLFLLKFGCIAASSCLYLSRYAKSRNFAVIASLAYTFCGFNVYNIFFNHMLEPAVIFPLMLWALDGFIYENRRGWFALSIGLALVDSYFFFLGNVTFIVLYFFVKLATGEYRLGFGRFGLLALEVALGVGIGMVLALPAFYNMIGNPRTDNFANGFGLLLYGNVQQYFAILSSMFLPPDPPYIPNLFTEGVVKWTSMSAFIPVLGMAGVLAYVRARRRGSIKWLLGLCLLMALVPILNSSYYAFNASYYARWYYMPLLMCAFATMRSLEDADIDLAGGARIVVMVTAALAVFGLVPAKTDDGAWKLGVAQEPAKFWLTWVTAMFGALLLFVLVKLFRGRRRFAPILLSAVLGFSVLYSVVHLSLSKFPWWEGNANFKAEQYDGTAVLDLPEDGQFYRIDAYNAEDNLGLWLNESCLQTFNSVVTPSIMEFYPMVGVKRDVSSKPEQKEYALRGLLSVKYTVMPLDEEEKYLTEESTMGWHRLYESGPFVVYENENFLPLGFTYDQYVRMDDLEAIRTEDRAPLLVRAIGLDAEQEEKYGRLFEGGRAVEWVPAGGAVKNAAGTGSEPPVGEEAGSGGWYEYDPVSFNAYTQDVIARRGMASYDAEADSSGFTVKIDLDHADLVFFAVPYDPGFTATVNGEAAEVEKVSGGMMAVLAPPGESTIVFTYRTPGFHTGLAISLVSLLGLAGYLALGAYIARRAEEKRKAAVARAALAAVPQDLFAAPAGGEPPGAPPETELEQPETEPEPPGEHPGTEPEPSGEQPGAE